MSDEVKNKARPAPPLDAERVQQWTHIPHVPNTSTPGGLSAPRVLLLIGVAALLHAGAWWVFQQAQAEPVITPPEIPEMTVELTSPAPPAPPVEEPPPPPPPPEPEVPQEDEDAVKEPPKPVEKPKPIEKPKPVVKPKPVPKPQPVKPAPPAPPAPAAPAAPTAPTVPTVPTAPAAPAAAPGPVKETAAVSGLASLGNPPPEYPSLALRRSWEGTVVLRIKVLPNGRAGTVEVTKSSGKQALDEAAVTAVRNWKFVPAKRGDTPIEGFATQTIAFKLPA